MTSDRIVEMTERECMQMLAANHFGRVAVNDREGPVVLPVNYVLDGDSVLFRSGMGTKVEAGARGSPASFEIDAVDERTRTGWSVVARGTLTDVYEPVEIERARRLPLEPFAGGERPHYLRLLIYELTGRRIDLPEGVPGSWYRPTGLGHVWLDRDAADLGL
jgi:nitroimidazol reductase NimA-like FMN-containing flavoprotein (pyridoxamine 5'-phosphate oxidase superfamily)